jgi:hypothetical protein
MRTSLPQGETEIATVTIPLDDETQARDILEFLDENVIPPIRVRQTASKIIVTLYGEDADSMAVFLRLRFT